MKPENLVHLRVWGDFACFTRPEMKVERVSYPIMTPSAARGILEAVFWEPQMYYGNRLFGDQFHQFAGGQPEPGFGHGGQSAEHPGLVAAPARGIRLRGVL
jgi:CRISPR-associated Cas5-like protein